MPKRPIILLVLLAACQVVFVLFFSPKKKHDLAPLPPPLTHGNGKCTSSEAQKIISSTSLVELAVDLTPYAHTISKVPFLRFKLQNKSDHNIGVSLTPNYETSLKPVQWDDRTWGLCNCCSREDLRPEMRTLLERLYARGKLIQLGPGEVFEYYQESLQPPSQLGDGSCHTVELNGSLFVTDGHTTEHIVPSDARLEIWSGAQSRISPIPPSATNVFFDLLKLCTGRPSFETEAEFTALMGLLPRAVATARFDDEILRRYPEIAKDLGKKIEIFTSLLQKAPTKGARGYITYKIAEARRTLALSNDDREMVKEAASDFIRSFALYHEMEAWPSLYHYPVGFEDNPYDDRDDRDVLRDITLMTIRAGQTPLTKTKESLPEFLRLNEDELGQIIDTVAPQYSEEMRQFFIPANESSDDRDFWESGRGGAYQASCSQCQYFSSQELGRHSFITEEREELHREKSEQRESEGYRRGRLANGWKLTANEWWEYSRPRSAGCWSNSSLEGSLAYGISVIAELSGKRVAISADTEKLLDRRRVKFKKRGCCMIDSDVIADLRQQQQDLVVEVSSDSILISKATEH